jgi:hypothetical protein
VLDRLGIAHASCTRGEMATCPGCGEDGALVCKDGGLKCLHDRCAGAGPKNNPGFRTNVDLVAHARSVEPAAAARQIAEWFGIEVLSSKISDTPEPPPGMFDDGPSAPAAKFEIIDAAAIFAALGEPEYLIDHIARRGSLVEIVSYGGSGKSWLGVEMTIAVASGTPWLGRFGTKAGRCLYLDWENGLYEMRRRFQAVARARDLSFPVSGVALSSMPSVYMTDAGDFGRAVLDASAGCALVVVDTLKAATPGVDENDSNMRVGLDQLRRVGEQTGCTFVVLVHGKKGGPNAGTDPREQGRGSSAIFDAADSVFHVTYTPNEPLRVSQTKARMGRLAEPFQVTISDTDNGGVLVSATAAARPESVAADDFQKLCDSVLEVVRANPGASGRLVRAKTKGARAQATLAALEMLERHGAIRNTGKSNAAKWIAMGGESLPMEDKWSQ